MPRQYLVCTKETSCFYWGIVLPSWRHLPSGLERMRPDRGILIISFRLEKQERERDNKKKSSQLSFVQRKNVCFFPLVRWPVLVPGGGSWRWWTWGNGKVGQTAHSRWFVGGSDPIAIETVQPTLVLLLLCVFAQAAAAAAGRCPSTLAPFPHPIHSRSKMPLDNWSSQKIYIYITCRLDSTLQI